jgi:hypothetical protein
MELGAFPFLPGGNAAVWGHSPDTPVWRDDGCNDERGWPVGSGTRSLDGLKKTARPAARGSSVPILSPQFQPFPFRYETIRPWGSLNFFSWWDIRGHLGTIAPGDRHGQRPTSFFSVSFWLKLAHLLRNRGCGRAGGGFWAGNIFCECVKVRHFVSLRPDRAIVNTAAMDRCAHRHRGARHFAVLACTAEGNQFLRKL